MVNSVYLSTRYNISTADFYSNDGASSFADNVAAILGIPLYSIRVVGISSGSTVVNAFVDS